MLTSTLYRRSPLLASQLSRATQAAVFSTTAGSTSDQKNKHKQEHFAAAVHPRFYESDFKSTSIKELEFVRSPFYDLGMHEHMREGDEASEFLTNIQLKIGMTQFITGKLQS